MVSAPGRWLQPELVRTVFNIKLSYERQAGMMKKDFLEKMVSGDVVKQK